MPDPSAAAPLPRPVPKAPAKPAPVATPAEPWGRVDEAGIVSVREGSDWRVVGEYPDGTPDEALAATGLSSLEDAFVKLIGSEEGLFA